MKYTIGLRNNNDIQRYAAEMLRKAPRMHKGDLVARAIYTYLGGKDMTEEELAILLTGQPSTGKRTVRHAKPKAANPDEMATRRTEKPDQVPETAPSAEPEKAQSAEPDYGVGTEDAAMFSDVMREFAGL